VVGRRLEQREVAVVGVAQPALQALDFLRHVLEVADELEQLLADGPEQALGAGARVEVEEAQVEQRRRLLLELQRVVVGLEEVLAATVAPRSYRLRIDLGLVSLAAGGGLVLELVDAQHVEHQHRVVGDQRAPDSLTMSGCGTSRSSHAPGSRRRRRSRTPAASSWSTSGTRSASRRSRRQAAAHVDELEPRPEREQLDVDPRRLAHRRP
jgi:hypothetical protein